MCSTRRYLAETTPQEGAQFLFVFFVNNCLDDFFFFRGLR